MGVLFRDNNNSDHSNGNYAKWFQKYESASNVIRRKYHFMEVSRKYFFFNDLINLNKKC